MNNACSRWLASLGTGRLHLWAWAALLLLIVVPVSTRAQNVPGLTVLAYHDVVDSPQPGMANDAVTAEDLAQQLQWLTTQGYRFVSAQQVLDAQRLQKALPDKSVLLTFDDGYRSFYTHALPLLLAWKAPCVLAVVGSWLTPDKNGQVTVDGVAVAATRYMSREEVRMAARTGLVEVASHTYALHHSINAGASGVRKPAVIARLFDSKNALFEGDAAYSQRLREDIKANAQLIEELTGAAPRILVWPYGRYSGKALDVARSAGHELTFSLDELSGFSSQLPLGRKYIAGSLSLREFASYVKRTVQVGPANRHLALSWSLLDAGRTGVTTHYAGLLSLVKSSAVNSLMLNVMGTQCSLDIQAARALSSGVLTHAVWRLRRDHAVQVLLDVQMQPCRSAADAIAALHEVVQLVAFDGFVIRGTEGTQVQAEELAKFLHAEQPGAMLVSNLRVPHKRFELLSLLSCAQTASALTEEDLPNWLEAEANHCTAEQLQLVRRQANAHSWGVRLTRAADVDASVSATAWPRRASTELSSASLAQIR